VKVKLYIWEVYGLIPGEAVANSWVSYLVFRQSQFHF